jgi:hypothetical protein
MEKLPNNTKASPAVIDEQDLNDDELKRLAKLLDVLMEVDFELNRQEDTANAC